MGFIYIPSLASYTSGPVSGSSTDDAIVRWDGTTGRILADSTVQIQDDGDLVMATDGVGNIGESSSAGRPGNVWATTNIQAGQKMAIGDTAPGSHSFLWIENSVLNEHPNLDIQSVQAERQPGIRFRADTLSTSGYALGGIRGFWGGNQVARVDLVRSDDAGADGPSSLKDEGYISFSVKKTAVPRAVVLKLDETGSLEFQNEANYDTNLLWAGTGNIGDGAGNDPTNINFTGNLNGIAAADFDTLTDGSSADTLHTHTSASVTEADPVFTASAAFGISAGDITNWDNAFGWGDHSAAGYTVGPASATDQAIARFDGATGKLIQSNSQITIDDTGVMKFGNLTASRVLQLDSNQNVQASSVTDLELFTLSGVSSNVQTQLDAKLDDFSGSTDNALVKTDGTGGDTLQESGVTIDDSDNINMPAGSELIFQKNQTGIRFVDDSDDDARIEATSNSLDFYIFDDSNPKLSLNEFGATINVGGIKSSGDGNHDLGAASNYWRNIYQRNAYIGGANVNATLFIEPGSSSQEGRIHFINNPAGANAQLGKVQGFWDTSEVARIEFQSGSDGVNKDDGELVFSTSEASGSVEERLRIDNLGVSKFTGQVYSSQDTETQAASATHTIDWNDGNSTEWDLESATGDVTLTLSNPQAGASYIIKIIQGSTARNITWPANVKWPGGTAPTISTTDDAVDVVSLYYDGTNYLAVFNQDFQ